MPGGFVSPPFLRLPVKQQNKTILVWAIVLAAIFGAASIYNSGTPETPRNYAAFLQDLRDGTGGVAGSELTLEVHKNHVEVSYDANDKSYRVTAPGTDSLYQALDQAGVNYRVEYEDESGFLTYAIMLVPMVIVVVLMVMFMRQMQAGGGKAMSFGKSKARLMNDHQAKVTFKDVAGIEEAREECEEIIDFLRDTRKYLRVGGRIPKGVLLMGPPGTGKTLLARAIAGEAGVAFLSISGSDFVEMFVGVGASRVRDLFEQGKKNGPCIIFIDEIDAVGRHRGAGLGGGHDEREQTLNQLLVEMDGFESNEGVILVAATNRPDVLDPALLRPGRFDRRIVVGLPDVRGREAILKVHTRKTPMADDVDLGIIARGTPGFSGADLENLVNEAALWAARHDRELVTAEDFDMARDKVMMGAERKSAKISDEEKLTTAWHEAGHTLVAALLPEGQIDPVHKVTIIPRGQALGLTHLLPEQDRLSLDSDNARAKIAMLMGGRIAEEIQFDGRKTTGAGNDIARATEIARRMVCEWGMSDRLGPLSFAHEQSEPFLGREIARQQNFSDATAQAIDQEVHDIVTSEYQRARTMLESNYPLLQRLALALVERESLNSQEIADVIAGKTLAPLAPAVDPAEAEEARKREEREDAESSGDALPSLRTPPRSSGLPMPDPST